MRKEIEVKARLRDAGAVEKKLRELGCELSDPKTQDDRAFVDDNYGPFDEFQPGKNILRIRKMKDKAVFTLKQPELNEQDAIEYETEVSHPEELAEALKLMGYKEMAQVHKVRRSARYNNWEVNLDEVDGVGTFIEVECIATSDDSAKVVQEELLTFLEALGVSREDKETHGYDTLSYMAKKQNE